MARKVVFGTTSTEDGQRGLYIEETFSFRVKILHIPEKKTRKIFFFSEYVQSFLSAESVRLLAERRKC